jgi:hypothetical protein
MPQYGSIARHAVSPGRSAFASDMHIFANFTFLHRPSSERD